MVLPTIFFPPLVILYSDLCLGASSVFGNTPHPLDEKPPAESAGRVRLRLKWQERKRLLKSTAVNEDDVELVLQAPQATGTTVTATGMKAVLTTE